MHYKSDEKRKENDSSKDEFNTARYENANQFVLKKTTDIPTSWGAGNGGEQFMTKYVHIIKCIILNKNSFGTWGDTDLDWLKFLTSDLTYSRSIPIISRSRPYPSDSCGQITISDHPVLLHFQKYHYPRNY